MNIIPAIDLLDGAVVRLLQGDPKRKTIYGDDPVEVANKWFNLGAERLHVVDLDGSFAGSPRNEGLVRAIVRAVPIPIQLGGGIRDLETAQAYIETGVERIVLGTAAVKQPKLLIDACRQWPGRVALAIDARGGRVVVEGWTESTSVTAAEFVGTVEKEGLAAIIYTDVDRDGMSIGPNVEATRQLAENVDIPVIISGGVGSMEDLRAIIRLGHPRIQAVIVGRALYAGKIDLKEAITLSKEAMDG
jgi:phosphoribosylformimino-5-aminoimidazole carboxamide ribotide isomerase